jgi:predicted DNA-binding transcriptional regulator AlpA
MLTTIDSPAPANSLLGDEYLTDPQLAQGIGVSTRTLARLHAKRQGPPRVRVGKKILYKRSSVLAWLAEQEEVKRPARKRRAS